MSKEKIFPAGIRFWSPRENAPEWVLGTVEIIDANELFKFLKEHGGHLGKCRLSVKKSAQGKTYMELDTYIPQNDKPVQNNANAFIADQAREVRQKAVVHQTNSTDLPF